MISEILIVTNFVVYALLFRYISRHRHRDRQKFKKQIKQLSIDELINIKLELTNHIINIIHNNDEENLVADLSKMLRDYRKRLVIVEDELSCRNNLDNLV